MEVGASFLQVYASDSRFNVGTRMQSVPGDAMTPAPCARRSARGAGGSGSDGSVAGPGRDGMAGWLGALPCSRAGRVRVSVDPGCFVAAGLLFLLLQSVGQAAQDVAAPRTLCSPPIPRVQKANGRAPRFLRSNIPHHTLAVSTWNSIRIILSGDVELNPGPAGSVVAHPTDQQQQNRPISVISQNVRSLRNKLNTLRSHSTELEAYDVIALTETWLNGDIADSELQVGLPRHVWFRRDRPSHGGGVACAVRAQLNRTRRPELEPDDTETLIIEVKTAPAVLIAVCYCKPVPDGGVLERTMTALQTAAARHPHHRIVAVGDFNLPDIEWSESTGLPGSARATVTWTSQRVTRFLDNCMVAGFVQHVWHPTRGEKTLDLVLSNALPVEATVRPGVFESDHSEVVCVVRHVKSHVPLVNRSKAFNYKRADFVGLRRSLQLLPWSVLDSMQVDEAVDLFYSFVEAAISEHVPIVTIKRKFPPWFDRELRNALRAKETAFRRMKRSGSHPINHRVS